VLKGGAGADTIFGNFGNDVLTGGAGNDVFLYRSTLDSNSAFRDTIMDFRSGDKIDLSLIDAVSGTPDNDAFSFIGTGAFTGHAGELRYAQIDGATALLLGDVDGDLTADFQLLVTIADAHPLVSADFVL
jgi:serralysin